MRKPRLITRGVEFLMDERDHTTILISLAKDAVPVDEHRLDLLRSKLRDLDNQIASDGRADAPRDSRGPKAPRVSFGRKLTLPFILAGRGSRRGSWRLPWIGTNWRSCC